MPRFAANLSMMFNEREFMDRFAAAADGGFDAVEFLFPYDHDPEAIAARLRANGLTQALFNLPPGDWATGERGLAALPERRAEFERSVATALRYAAATGAKRLHLMAGNAPADDPAHAGAYEAAVLFAAETAAPAGVTIVLEPINRRDMPAYFLNDFDRAAALIRRLALPNLKLQFDIYHRQILHGDVIRGLEALFDITGHVQVASVPLRNEPETGELADARIFATLDRLGYDGFVGCEYRPAGATLDGLGWFEPYRRHRTP
jgi:hydroxypyruvate isomerase